MTPVRQKKISFDDSSMTKVSDKGDASSIPSFATLPRKKKLVNSNSTNSMAAAPVQSSTQVTWMKEVAQKGIINNPLGIFTLDIPCCIILLKMMIVSNKLSHSLYDEEKCIGK